MQPSTLGSEAFFHIGPVAITLSVVTTWGIMLALGLGAVLLTRRLRLEPTPLQTAVEAAVTLMQGAIEEVVPGESDRLLPFIGTLWVFVLTANLVSVIPGLHSPTRDLSTTTALALLVFLSVHYYGIRANGLKTYLRHYLSPNPIMLPFHIISEISRTLALAIRLFGNMMSLEMAALLVLLVAGFLVPIPLLMLHIVEALVQAYIFGILALIYIGSALQSQQHIAAKSDPRRNEKQQYSMTQSAAPIGQATGKKGRIP